MILRVPRDGDIVLVDDDPDFHFLVRCMYRKSPLADNTLVCLDGAQPCLEHLDGVEAGERDEPALILMDINMPGMSGIECVRAIRQRTGPTAATPITMLSTSDHQPDIEASLAAGADCYQEKPFDMTSMRFERGEDAA